MRRDTIDSDNVGGRPGSSVDKESGSFNWTTSGTADAGGVRRQLESTYVAISYLVHA
jgi:hypothetical protein